MITGDWGISRLLFFISKGRIEAKEIFGYSNDSNYFLKELEKEYKNQDNTYIFYICNDTGFSRLDAFKEFVREKKILCSERFISGKCGDPIFAVYKFKAEELNP